MHDTLLDELACAGVTTAWTHGVDNHDIDAILGLFAEDAVLHWRTGEPMTGHEMIRQVLLSRDPARVTRHVIAPPFVRLVGPDEAKGVTNFVLYDGTRSGADAPDVLPVALPATIGEFHQSYRRTAQGWLISEHRSVAIFRRAAG